MSNLKPMDFCPDAEWHTFTPTMESGYACDSAKYKMVSDQFVYVTMTLRKSGTAGAIDAYVGTLPSWMFPSAFSPISTIGSTSSYVYVTTNGAINTSGRIRVYAPSTNSYYIYVSGIIPLA